MELHTSARALTQGVVVAVAVAGCHSAPRTAVIGYAYTYHLKPAIAVAAEEIAAQPAGRGARIVIVPDSGRTGDPADVEVQRAEHMAAIPGIVAVVGHSGSRASLAAAPIYNDARIVQVTPNSTSRLLEHAGPWTFDLAPDDSVEGAFIGGFLADRLHALRVTVFYENDEYGTGLRDGVLAALTPRGVVVLDRVPIDLTSDFPTLVEASLKLGVPDAFVVAGRQRETGTIARLLRERGIRRPVVAGDGSLVLPDLARLAGPAADSLYVVAFWLPDAPDSLSRAFVERYRRLTGEVPQSADALSHDALMLVVAAIREVGPDPAAVRSWLGGLGVVRPPFEGVTGPIAFATLARPRLLMTRLEGGVPRRVAP